MNIAIYTILIILQAICIKYPNKGKKLPLEDDVAHEAIVIIACHCSADEIGKTVSALLNTFAAERIFIADNGSSMHPIDSTREHVMQLGIPENNYYYFPVPGKTSALLGTAKKVKESCNINFNYVVLIDDDTLVPNEFAIPKYNFRDENVACITYGIEVPKQDTFVEMCADFDYKIWTWRNYWRSKWTTLKFAVGIFVVWREDIFFKVYSQAPTQMPGGLPFGEDGHCGRIARSMGYKIRQELKYSVRTYAPPILFPPLISQKNERVTGYGAVSMHKQRSFRWYRNYPRRIFVELYLFLTYNCKPPLSARFYYAKLILKNIAYRIDYLYGWFLIFQAVNVPTSLILMVLHNSYWNWFYVHILFITSGIFSFALFNFYVLRNRSDLQVKHNVTIVLYPLFTTFIVFSRFFGFIGSIIYYIPFVAPYKSCWNQDVPCKKDKLECC